MTVEVRCREALGRLESRGLLGGRGAGWFFDCLVRCGFSFRFGLMILRGWRFMGGSRRELDFKEIAFERDIMRYRIGFL